MCVPEAGCCDGRKFQVDPKAKSTSSSDRAWAFPIPAGRPRWACCSKAGARTPLSFTHSLLHGSDTGAAKARGQEFEFFASVSTSLRSPDENRIGELRLGKPNIRERSLYYRSSIRPRAGQRTKAESLTGAIYLDSRDPRTSGRRELRVRSSMRRLGACPAFAPR